MISARAVIAASGRPPPSDLPDTRTSGCTPKCSIAHTGPVRPIPAWTSSLKIACRPAIASSVEIPRRGYGAGARYTAPASGPNPCLSGWTFVVIAIVRSVRPWKPRSNTTTPGRPVNRRRDLHRVLAGLLQGHHMVSDTPADPPATVAGLEANTLADGLFHAGRRSPGALPPGPAPSTYVTERQERPAQPAQSPAAASDAPSSPSGAIGASPPTPDPSPGTGPTCGPG